MKGSTTRRWDVGTRGARGRKTEILTPQELEDWHQVFRERGGRGLRRAGRDPTERELIRTRAKVGKLMMKLELAMGLLVNRGTR